MSEFQSQGGGGQNQVKLLESGNSRGGKCPPYPPCYVTAVHTYKMVNARFLNRRAQKMFMTSIKYLTGTMKQVQIVY